MVCVRREREATVQGIRGLTHLRNAGNEVMEKTLSEIKPHRFVKVLSASQDAITHISRLRRQPLVIVPLAVGQLLLGVFLPRLQLQGSLGGPGRHQRIAQIDNCLPISNLPCTQNHQELLQ